jgi:hypothetical protein
MEISGKVLKNGNIDVSVICIDFCTEEDKYLDPNSHFIHIPRDLYLDFIKKKSNSGNANSPLYVGIRNSKNPNIGQLYFGRVEPSTTTANSHYTMALAPKWVFDKLQIDLMDGTIDIVYVPNPEPVSLIKLKGSNSLYAKTDIKSTLEMKLSGYNCLNIGEEFKVDETDFRVIELRNKYNKVINFGSIYNIDECNLDFEMCDEEIEKEKIRNLQKIKTEISVPIKSTNKYSNITRKYSSFGAKVHSLKEEDVKDKKDEYKFEDNGIKVGGSKMLSKKEIAEARIKAIENFKLKII